MNKKLIFLRKGVNVCLDNFPIDIDFHMTNWGYKNAIEDILACDYEWYYTTCPTVLSATDKHNNPIWWNEERQAWDIYLVTDTLKGTLKPIQDFTDKELRKAHNIEKMYLNGGFFDD